MNSHNPEQAVAPNPGPRQKLPPIRNAQAWLKKLWPTVNRRRGELIDRQFIVSLSAEEAKELDLLQKFAEAYVAPYDEVRLKSLEALVEEAERRSSTGGAPAEAL